MGLGHTCVRLTSGDVKCWGESLQGQLGLGDNNHRGDQPNEMGDALPIVDLGATPVARLFAGGDDTCVQLTSGAIKCWGDNNIGQLGIGTMSDMGGASKGFTLDKVATVKLFSRPMVGPFATRTRMPASEPRDDDLGG